MNIAIVFGANSHEHEISIISAISISKILNKNLTFIFADEKNDFYLIEKENLNAKYFSSYDYKSSSKIFLNNNGFYKKSLFSMQKIQCELVINMVHGSFGEDGVFSAMLENSGYFYISPRIDACCVSFDKKMTKMYAKSIGVKTLDFEITTSPSHKTNFDFPVIIKPCRGGSSLGVNVANNTDELKYFIQEALEFDTEIMIEPFVKNVKEYNQAGYFAKKVIFSNIEEPQKEEILDFDKKYLDFSRDDKANSANITDKLQKEIQDNFSKVFSNIFKGAIIRCDFFSIDNEVYLNEINPVPGSLSNYLFDDFNKVIDDIFFALEKKEYIPINYNYINNINKAKG